MTELAEKDYFEEQVERDTLHFGTVKKKADLLDDVDVSPNKLRHAVKKFGEPIPGLLLEADEYTSDLFDFLLDFDEKYYEKLPESKFRERLAGYVLHEIWLVKLKRRTILNKDCAVAMDMRKCLKDHAANIAQIAGRLVKNVAEGLPTPTKKELRELIQESADEVVEVTFGTPLKEIKLLK